MLFSISIGTEHASDSLENKLAGWTVSLVEILADTT